MNEAPHPSSLGEILDQTAALYRSRFLVFAGISVIPTGSLLLFGAGCIIFFAWFGSGGQSRLDPTTIGILSIVFFAFCGIVVLPIAVGVSALSNAAMNHAVARAFFDEKPTIRGAYKDAWQRGWEFVGLYLLQGLIVWVAPFVLFLLFTSVSTLARIAGGGAAGSFFIGMLFFIVMLAVVVYVVLALLRISLAFPAAVVEKIGPWTAIRRSNSLSEGTRGRIVLLYLLGAALSWILSLAITIPITVIAALIPASSNPERVQTASVILVALIYAASFAMQALIRPVYGIALMLFYYDQRIRKEGFDIEWMMQRAGLVGVLAGVPPVPVDVPVAVPAASFASDVHAVVPVDVQLPPALESIPETNDPQTALGESS
jgi:hypothetical protein